MRALILIAALLSGSVSSAVIVDRIVANVNDQVITLSDLTSYKEKLKAGKTGDELLIPDEKTRSAVLNSDQKILDVMIDEKIIDSEIKKQDLSATIERVEQEIRSIAKAQHLTHDELRQALHQQGTSMAEFQDMIKRRIERQSLIDKAVTSKVRVSDDEVMAYYLSKKHGVGQIYEYTIAHILFQPNPNDPDGEKKAEERAEAALRKIKEEHQSFEVVLKEDSEDSDAANGGILGTFKAGEMIKEFENAVSHLEVGEVSDVIRSRGVFQILKLVDKKLVTDPDFEKEAPEIRKVLTEAAYKKQFQFWLNQKRQEAYIWKHL